MKIHAISNLPFKQLPMNNRINGLKLIDNLAYPTIVDLFTIHPDDYDGYVHIKIDNGNTDLPASHEEVDISKHGIYVNEMFTSHETRNLGMGRTLHLINVIEMLENDIPYIHLEATSEAIPYHAKFGFKSDERWCDGLRRALSFISKTDNEYIHQINELKNKAVFSREDEIAGNKIVDNFLSKALKKYSTDEIKYLLDFYLHMKLTKEDVLNNKSFYNQLFKEHNLDYVIN